MNTNQSKRKKVFSGRPLPESASTSTPALAQLLGRTKRNPTYTDNTIHFGEDYPTEKKL